MSAIKCISDFIFAETEVEKADVILIPGASQSQLMERAAELYNKGYARYILPSGGTNKKLPDYETEWEFLKTVGIQHGVPENALLKEDKAQNTFQNAQFSWEVLQRCNIKAKKIILVCKAFHSRRALLTYKLFFPQDVIFYVSPIVDYRNISKDNWFLREEKIAVVMREVEKIGSYFKDKI